MKNKDIIKKHAKEFIKNFILFIILMLVALLSFSRLIHKDKSDSDQNDTTDETEISLFEQIEDKIKSIEERYECINIIESGEEKEYIGFEYKISNDERKKLSALEGIDTILGRLPDNIIEEGLDMHGGKLKEKYGYDVPPDNGLNIVLCSEINNFKSDNMTVTGKTRFDPDDKIVNIFINVNYSGDVAKTFSHELYHFFKSRIGMQKLVGEVYTDEDWKNELPKGYKYYGSKTNLDSMPYTVKTEQDINNVYFVTEYSQKNIDEDKCEIFAYLLSTDEDEELPKAYESPHVRNRALMIIREFDEFYDTVDENAYWNRIFEENATN
ncbi:MAG: hypothetical protein K2M73_05085 [Lachnospiraceae bacterium]|nr:hypothetical protein [Lachnospiraceae bacterium]